MTSPRRQLGAWGERVAALHLESNGYQIIARNWHCARGEIDLVAKTADEYVFVEVKTRRGREMGTPEEAMTPGKARRLLELAQHYIVDHDLENVSWRVDLVAVELDGDGVLLRCEHIENAVPLW
jgi:putative endonuclease